MNTPEYTPQKTRESTVMQRQRMNEAITNPRIAIIDDEPINIEAVQEHLRMAGYQQFFTTCDSTKAIDLIRKEQPDVVLLDIMMPQVSGLDILCELRDSEYFFDLPVIILTAATDREMKLKALSSGASEFLTKPLDSAELEIRLKNVLAMKAHYDRLKAYAKDLEQEVKSAMDVLDRLSGKSSDEPNSPQEEHPAVRTQSQGMVFDPVIVDAFFDRIDQVLQVCRESQNVPATFKTRS